MFTFFLLFILDCTAITLVLHNHSGNSLHLFYTKNRVTDCCDIHKSKQMKAQNRHYSLTYNMAAPARFRETGEIILEATF